MNTVLLILGFLSVGVIVIATYVFMVAARNYVSREPFEQQTAERFEADEVNIPQYVGRLSRDRRQINNVIHFPITLPNGEVVEHDRRLSDRRSKA